ncbi:MAG: sulfurtransferase [Desulfovibrio sp.]|nr:sulfurtransferase [Desulfovibrio sp.]
MAGASTTSAEEVRRLLTESPPGSVTLLDVRQDWEYSEFHLPGALLVPLGELPDRLGEIDRNTPVVAYCRSGRRSAAAASLLAGQGFSPVVNMAGGILAWQGAGAVGPVDQGLFLLPSDMGPGEVFRAAYAMEQRLARFYEGQAAATGNPEVAGTFRKLAGFEDKHANLVMNLWRKSGAVVPDQAGLDADVSDAAAPTLLEGGLPGDSYLGQSGAEPERSAEVLELAMAVEAQAMDLYLRGSRVMRSLEARQALVRLAGEEKSHLAALAALFDRMSPKPVT